MKKITLFLVLLVGLCHSLQAQNCSETTALEFLHGNDAKIMFRNGGDMFWDGASNQFKVPYQTGQPSKGTIFAGALWMGGYDSGNNLKVAAQTYRSSGNDYWAGPLDGRTGEPVVNACQNFDKIWKVKRWEIEAHIQDFTNDGVINNQTARTILAWPGKGNPHFAILNGFSLPNQSLAPFYDRNGNGLYDPLLGDYPVFEHNNATAVAEDMLWYVFNDNGNLHTQTNLQPLKVEVQVTAYSFYCENDSLLNRTFFTKNRIINRSDTTIYDFKAGIWSDPDLGCNHDDYIGTIPSMNTIYSYNSDNNDDNPCGVSGPLGYGTNPPVQATTILNQHMSSSIYHINSASDPKGDPHSPLGYYSLLSGRWTNGVNISAVGSGYNPVDTNAVNYIFPDSPNNPSGWSMTTASLSGLDVRMLGSVAKDSLVADESFWLDVAYSYHRNNDSSNTQNVNLLYQQLPLIQQFYDNGHNMTSCTRKPICTTNCVYPGDMNNNGVANDFDLLDWGVAVGQNAAATARTMPNDNWWPYSLPTPSTYGYVDANGDGPVDEADWLANTENWGETHAAYTGFSEGYNIIGNNLFFKRFWGGPTPIFPQYDTIVQVGEDAIVHVHFGDTNQVLSNVYGVTFRVDYDSSVFEYKRNISPYGYAGLQAGWLNGQVRQTEEKGRIHFVNVRTNGTDTTGGGSLGKLGFTVKPNAPIGQQVMSTQLCFSDFQAIDKNGNDILIGAQCLTIHYQDTSYALALKETQSDATHPIRQEPQPISIPISQKNATSNVEMEALNIRLAPNPTASTTTLFLETASKQNVTVQVADMMGRQVLQKHYQLTAGHQQLELDTQQLPTGVYSCTLQIGQQLQTLQLVKVAR